MTHLFFSKWGYRLCFVLLLTLTTAVGMQSLSAQAESAIPSPAFSQPSGFYDEPFKLTILSAEGFSVYYTLDGSDPNESPSRKTYSKPFQMLRNQLVRAIAVKSEHFNSAIAKQNITGVDSRFEKGGICYRLVDDTEEDIVEIDTFKELKAIDKTYDV